MCGREFTRAQDSHKCIRARNGIMRIVVIGANGQVGSEVLRAAGDAGLETVAFDHASIEVTDQASVEHALSALRAGDVVVNTAALHRTDECEEAPDRALSINAVGSFQVAIEARRREATVVYLSSDFVFDGAKHQPYVESDTTHPLNVYGMTKRAGELAAWSANPSCYIVRISSVFGVAGSSGKGGNFVETMVAKAQRGESPRVVDDIIMAPTSASDAGRLLVQIIVAGAPFDTYHLANAGQCSWYEFADKIFELIGSKVRATRTTAAEVEGKACRPRYSVLASEKLQALGLHTRAWREALEEYLVRKGYSKRE
jgi:dTDP-4-dehydrorhamnose reductase